jgi:RimJ/RimL family protein N-acetyltransferase
MREVFDRINPPWQCVLWIPMSGFDASPFDDRVSLRVISEFTGGVEQAILEKSLGASGMSVFSSRVIDGCQLCVLLKGQAVAGTLFFVFGRAHRFQHLVLTEQDAVILDARIAPEFRGQGLYSVFLNLSIGTLNGKGIERVFAQTSEHNEPSLRALRRVGFRYLMRYKTYLGIYKYDARPF